MSDVLCLHLDTSAMPDRVHSGALSPGTRAGRYEVESFLGAGGMGEIYIARDTILGRRIALKVLPEGCGRDRIARFIREAKASSALNHPAIVSVHDAGSADGIHFLAMELIDGEPLSVWMRSHHSLTRVAELMAQVADGLACAHAAGIIHRDLKPANIMIGRAGFAKIVDFGVAKLAERSANTDDATDKQTADGLQVGTVAYMSPEQVASEQVDYRSDIFSFGIVLYELLAGVHPFASANPAATIYNIAHLDPPLDAIPSKCRRIVARCLAKEAGQRYQAMKDIAHELRDSLAKTESTSKRRTFPAWTWIAASLLAVAVIVGALVVASHRFREKPAPEVVTPQRSMEQITTGGNVRSAAISPDGKFLAYGVEERGLRSLWVKQTATGSSTQIVSPSTSFYWQIKISPDSDYIYYTASKPPSFAANIYQVPMLGGEPRSVVANVGNGLALSPDGRHVAFFRYDRDGASLIRAEIDGTGERNIVTFKDFQPRRLPAWSPDGKSIAFVKAAAENSEQQIEEIVLQTRAQRVVSSFSRPILSMTWLPDSSGMLASAAEAGGAQLWMIPSGGGAPTSVPADIDSYVSPSLTANGQSLVAVRAEAPRSVIVLSVDSDGGTHAADSGHAAPAVSEVRWIDADHMVYDGVAKGIRTLFVIPRVGGQPHQIIHGMSASNPSVSPDGKRLAFISDRSGSSQVWLSDTEGNDPKQLTSGGYPARSVDFSSDSTYVYYCNGSAIRVPVAGGNSEYLGMYAGSGIALSRDGHWLMSIVYREEGQRIYLYRLGPSRPVHTIALPFSLRNYARFHPSSREVSFIGRDKNGVNNIWLQKIDGGTPRQITNFDHGDIYAFDWSPDGKWLAVASGEPKADVVIVRNFR
jgi:eukaryotic-like serine/threonine-protein kinase